MCFTFININIENVSLWGGAFDIYKSILYYLPFNLPQTTNEQKENVWKSRCLLEISEILSKTEDMSCIISKRPLWLTQFSLIKTTRTSDSYSYTRRRRTHVYMKRVQIAFCLSEDVLRRWLVIKEESCKHLSVIQIDHHVVNEEIGGVH